MKKKLTQFLKSLLNRISFTPSLYKPGTELQKFFQKSPLIVVDVGATGGVEKRWRPIKDLCHFITFDPDGRVENLNQKNSNFPIGLWSQKIEKKLHLAAFPSASTVCSFHKENLASFLNAPCHEVVSSQTIELDSMERVLEGKKKPDFIKVDAEGADLEILKGAENFLKTSCLGLQVEAPFYERHEKAPFFSDIDTYLRNLGFILLDLDRERWIRKNGLHSSVSRPQVIWANAVYMLSIESFLNRFSDFDSETKDAVFLKFLVLLLVYQMHDYAEELRQKAFGQNLISKDINELSHQMIRKSMPSKTLYFSGLFWNISLGLVGTGLFCWNKSVREQSSIFLKQQLHLLASGILNNLRTGPYQSCLSDEE